MPLTITKPAKQPVCNLMVYGDPGVGKTTLASTTPNPLFLDVDGGLMSVAHKDFDVVEVGKHQSVIQDLEDAYMLLIGSEHSYETIVVDTITELQRKLADELQMEIHQATGRDRDLMTLQDWGKNTAQTRRFLRAMIDLPIHTIFVAQAELYVREDSTQMRMPMLTAKLRNAVMAMTSIIGCLGIKAGEGDKPDQRVLLTRPHGMFYAKDRSGKLPVTMVDPTIPQILDLVWGEGAKV